jgi:hypothetical protein
VSSCSTQRYSSYHLRATFVAGVSASGTNNVAATAWVMKVNTTTAVTE